ncbi:MAG TPA: metallophosphoesterase [Bacteroidota bacterium]|nr:metallophosphoesterase [Bacteroidota bacterium]
MSWVIWISILLIFTVGGFSFINWRLINTMGWPILWKNVARILLALMFVVPLSSMFMLRYIEGVSHKLAWITYVTLGFLSFVFTLLIIRDLTVILGITAKWLASLFSSEGSNVVDTSRRDFLIQTSNLGILGAAGILTAYGVYQARRKPGIVNLTIPIKNLPADFEGFRIVQITDIHAGLTVKRDWTEIVAQQVSELKPDLIAFTGDLADGSVPHLREHVEPFAFLNAPYGKFFVTGNHEYYSDVLPWVEEIGRMGYKVLNNEHAIVERNGSSLVLAGVTDYSGGDFLPEHKSDPRKAVDGAPADTVKILLAHQPRSLHAAEPLGFDFIITGHTHGGQFFPWNWLAAIGQPYIKGLHRHNGTWVYVSMGTGYWGPPVRLGTRSEITLFTLTADQQTA